jgi:excisionase family DNA binding protein
MRKTDRLAGIAPATFTPIEVAALIGIDRSTAYRWLKRGILPAPTIKVGRTVRWSAAAIDEWLAKGVQA